jgi:predicted secreted Zn-dependent protease
MKKIITMVGTSLFENYLEKYSSDTNFKNAYSYFENNKIKANGLDKELNRKGNIEKSLKESYFKKQSRCICRNQKPYKIKRSIK